MPQIAAKLRSVFALARAGGPVSPDPGRQVSQIAAKLPSPAARLVPAPPSGPSGGPGGLRGSVWSSRLKGNVSFRKSYRYFSTMRRAALRDRPRRPRPAARFGVPPSILAAVDGGAKGRAARGVVQCSRYLRRILQTGIRLGVGVCRGASVGSQKVAVARARSLFPAPKGRVPGLFPDRPRAFGPTGVPELL